MRKLDHPAQEEEQMDAADLDPAIYARVLTDLAQVNRWTFAARPTLDFVARAVGDAPCFSLLDVGFGDGDLLRAIARWAEKRRIRAALTGIDLNPGSARVASGATPDRLDIAYLTGDYRAHLETAAPRGGYDLIVSSLVAHHMSHAELIDFLRTMEAKARRGWHINDLHRHIFSYLGFPLLARIMGWHRIVREDGQLSIARAFRPGEWPPLLAEAGIGPAAAIKRVFPFRLCVERLH
ncbi:methyltransferase domain-containing protein [Rhizorhabdus dicambivorans]|uniref:Methyltransferase type 12 n=1 Tax=Rhizorhabdus dicambivorans TaxID=1850238 RepID=A0A2A4FZF5_9SPHN|nr:methyltransferase domain-containing protein [Rhizorhabdus dicambivorans]ATE66003.1 methyltransferase type 12 [Rhizorhabdus dicambivorans]PCE43120.1 methyltransferase type 12 [Rhizorhabdus dicambivorans]